MSGWCAVDLIVVWCQCWWCCAGGCCAGGCHFFVVGVLHELFECRSSSGQGEILLETLTKHQKYSTLLVVSVGAGTGTGAWVLILILVYWLLLLVVLGCTKPMLATVLLLTLLLLVRLGGCADAGLATVLLMLVC